MLNNEIIDKLVSQDNKITRLINDTYEREIKPLWREIITDVKKQGYIDSNLDDDTLLVYMDVLREGFSARSDLIQGMKDNLGFVEQLAHLMFYGFLNKDINLFGKEQNI